VSSPGVLEAVEDALVARLRVRPQRASVSFVGVEPIDVLRFEPAAGERLYVSLGMARRPMTPADAFTEAADGPRAELALRLHDPTDVHGDVWRRLALLAAAPAVEGVVYAPGMTVELGEPLTRRSACTGFVVGDPVFPDLPTPVGPVAILAVTPAMPTELAWCRARGSADLRARWARAETDLLDLGRAPVRLDG
jgi:hypothetical protein